MPSVGQEINHVSFVSFDQKVVCILITAAIIVVYLNVIWICFTMSLSACLENLNIPPCVWFQGEGSRNAIASIVAGFLFFTGWWVIIDVQVQYPEQFKGAYHLCGVFGAISFFMVNSVSNAVIRGDNMGGDCMQPRGARVWLFLGFVMGFAAIIAACWILFVDFVTKSPAVSQWAGSGLFLQNCCIFLSSLIYKFGRVEEQW